MPEPVQAASQVICQFPIWRAVLSPLAILISGVGGWVIALESIASSREISRKSAFIDFLENTKRDENYNEGMKYLKAVRDDHREDISRYANDGFLQENEERKDVEFYLRYVLNSMEHMAAGLREEIYDEPLAYRLRKTSVCKVWEVAQPFILERRRKANNNRLYREFENLAIFWQKDCLAFNHHKKGILAKLKRA